jgi:SAM-dependent methyltransferase
MPDTIPVSTALISTVPTELTKIRRLSHANTNRKVFELALPQLVIGSRVLDLGAGQGYFSQQAGEYLRRSAGVLPSTVLSACDQVPAQFSYGDVTCNPVDESGRLPYPADHFDLVCSLEVIEHVEDQFAFLREAYRVLKPGGRLILSTPNVLNMNSRWRYLHSGFTKMFDPLPLDRQDLVHTSGHIHPIPFYYLAYAMHTAGFSRLAVHYDHLRRSALFQLLLFGPIMFVGRIGFRIRMRRLRPRAMEQSHHLVTRMNSFRMLTARSVIVVAVK